MGPRSYTGTPSAAFESAVHTQLRLQTEREGDILNTSAALNFALDGAFFCILYFVFCIFL